MTSNKFYFDLSVSIASLLAYLVYITCHWVSGQVVDMLAQWRSGDNFEPCISLSTCQLLLSLKTKRKKVGGMSKAGVRVYELTCTRSDSYELPARIGIVTVR